jgi:hypothetical protein
LISGPLTFGNCPLCGIAISMAIPFPPVAFRLRMQMLEQRFVMLPVFAPDLFNQRPDLRIGRAACRVVAFFDREQLPRQKIFQIVEFFVRQTVSVRRLLRLYGLRHFGLPPYSETGE